MRAIRLVSWTAIILVGCNEPALAPHGARSPSFAAGGVGRPVVLVNPNVHGNGTATTIQEGIDMVGAGGRVMIKPGTYAEAIVIDKGLTLEGIETENGPVIVAPPGAPTIAVQVATLDPVTIRGLTVHFGGLNGIRGDGAVNITVERVALLAAHPPTGRGYMLSAVNDPNVTGLRARLVVHESFLDGSVVNFVPGTPGIPQMFGIVAQGDVDAFIERNTVRRTGGACLYALMRADGGGATNADFLHNDLDECHPTGRVGAVIVGAPPILPTTPITATGVVNVVGNTIRNTVHSCVASTGIFYEFGSGRIEHNLLADFVQTCATPSRSSPAAIFIGSPRKIAGSFIPPTAPRVQLNDLGGNAQAGLRIGPNQLVSLDARCNWWGDASGPSGVASGSGDAVVVETGGTRPVMQPFATRPIAADGDCALRFSLWSEPVNVGTVVNTSANESNPALSPDQLALYFQSTRPGGLGGFDLWVSRRAALDGPWEAPVNLGSAINGPGSEFAPNISSDGLSLFFASDRPGGQGLTDIYVSHRTSPTDDFGWSEPVALGPEINTAAADQAPAFLSNGDDSGILYFSRGPSIGVQDIYQVSLDRDHNAIGPAVLVSELSDPTANDARPAVRSDGLEILFFSTRAGGLGTSDLWSAQRNSVQDAWSVPENLGTPINTAVLEQHPALSLDGRTVVFSSTRTGSVAGSSDIWMATRTPLHP